MVSEMHLAKRLAILSLSCMAFGLTGSKPSGADRSLPKVAGETPRNIIFILADDHARLWLDGTLLIDTWDCDAVRHPEMIDRITGWVSFRLGHALFFSVPFFCCILDAFSSTDMKNLIYRCFINRSKEHHDSGINFNHAQKRLVM